MTMIVANSGVVDGLVMLTSARAATDQIAWSHVGEDLGEALPIPGDSFTWISEWQLLPYVVVSRLAVHVGEVLLTRGTGLWSQRLFTEHSILLGIAWATLPRE